MRVDFRTDAVDTTHFPVVQQLAAAGLLGYLTRVDLTETTVRAIAVPGLLTTLQQDRRFAAGGLHLLHGDVGDNRRDFRSYRGTFGKGSLQIVLDATTGAFYADVDQWNPYADVVNYIGHGGEVVGNFTKRLWRAVTKTG